MPQGPYKGRDFRYLLFRPHRLVPGESYPAIVWVHGIGDDEFDLHGQVKHLELVLSSDKDLKTAEFYVIAVQCPRDIGSWLASSDGYSDNAELVHPIDVIPLVIEEVTSTEPIHKDAITLIGVSGGGSACWHLARRASNLFAAMAPLSGAACELRYAEHLVGLPIWAFHNKSDFVVPIQPVRDLVQRINLLGGQAYLSEPPGADHNSWIPAFEHHNLLDWLLWQRRNAWTNTWPPGYRMWTWWQAAAQLGFPAILVICWLAERRRRIREYSRTG